MWREKVKGREEKNLTNSVSSKRVVAKKLRRRNVKKLKEEYSKKTQIYQALFYTTVNSTLRVVLEVL
ncbi:MAG TPA: hypothetical protein VI278_05005 [Nitrososphaeraceae archaeon]